MDREIKGAVAPEPVQVEPLLSVSEVTKMLNLGRDTVKRLIREGDLPSIKIGARHKVVPSSLATWVKQREQSVIQEPDQDSQSIDAMAQTEIPQ